MGVPLLLFSKQQKKKSITYSDRILALSPLAYWPLNDLSGTTMTNLVSATGNGSYKNSPVLGETGIGDGQTSVKFNDGVANQCALPYTAALNAAFNGLEGSAFVWCKVLNSGVWTDGTARGIFLFGIDNVNYIRAIRSTTNNVITLSHRFGAAAINKNSGSLTTTEFFQLAMTWSYSNNRLKCYINGVDQGAAATGLGNWSGNLDATNYCAIAGLATTPTNVFTGWLAHLFLFNRELSAAEVASIYAMRPF